MKQLLLSLIRWVKRLFRSDAPTSPPRFPEYRDQGKCRHCGNVDTQEVSSRQGLEAGATDLGELRGYYDHIYGKGTKFKAWNCPCCGAKWHVGINSF